MIQDEHHELLFSVRRSVRYHMRRRRFYEQFDLWVNALSIILGSATVYGVLNDPSNTTVALVAGFFVTVISAFNLVMGSSIKAREHSDLATQFIGLEKSIISQVKTSQQHLIDWTSTRLDIELKEPPVLQVLNVICHNELAKGMGYDATHQVKLGFFQRLLAPFFDLNEHSLMTSH